MLQYFIKPHMLPAYQAIHAFNLELARIPDVVSTPNIGSIRMQFWRDTINATFDSQPPAEPVAVLLASVLSAGFKLRKLWFHRLIDMRDRKLVQPGFTNVSELESYAESTYSTILYLILSAYPLKSLHIDHLASHIGKAAGICAVLRGFPLLAFPQPLGSHNVNPPGVSMAPERGRQGAITLPLDVMAQCGVREEDVLRNGPSAVGLKDAIFTTATRASDHLITARSMLGRIKQLEDPEHEYEHMDDEGHEYTKYDTGVRLSAERRADELQKGYSIVMGPAISTQLWLDRLQKCDFDIFDNSLRRPDWKLPVVSWMKHRRRYI